jgi:predicted  nucleic acid-binding Zn-ribbon protein
VNRRRDQIINEILKLLIVILNRLEQTVVVQSQANFLNQDIQVKYTELISQVQLKDTSGIDVSDTEALENLKSDNEIVQKRLEDLRNARTTVRDAGKELTDALSATNDQIEQQSQLGSSIVQQLGELIRAIFK